jgi:hypothetical protein
MVQFIEVGKKQSVILQSGKIEVLQIKPEVIE